MAIVAKLHMSPQSLGDCYRIDLGPRFRPLFHRSPATLDAIPLRGQPNGRRGLSLQTCRSFRSDGGSESVEKEVGEVSKGGASEQTRLQPKKKSRALYSLKSFILKVSGSRPPLQGEYRDAVAKAEEIFFSLSGGDSQMNTLIWYSWLGGIVIGTMIGANLVLEEHCRAGPRNVVITGSTRGLGKALAREFLLSGDRVVVASRSPESVHRTVTELKENLKDGMLTGSHTSRENMKYAKVVGIDCDVCNPDDVRKLANFAVSELGPIDIWINNAGTNKGFKPLLQFTNEDIEEIVSTNLTGSLICTREAMHVMNSQEKGGHIFNMDGAGSGGSSTPLTAVYGATKCGLRQFQASLLKEFKWSKIGVHTASPGMVLTDLLLSGSTLKNKQMFNIICELPETVARSLVPRMRVVKGTGKAINYLTPPRILLALVTAWLRQGRWFDDQGRALYAAEADRIRNWAESRAQLSFTDAMEMYTENTWVSVFSLSVVCAFIILSSTGSTLPGT